MPTIRVVMPNGTTKSFREGTPKSAIRRAINDMLADMAERDGSHEPRRVLVTGNSPTYRDYLAAPSTTGASGIPELNTILSQAAQTVTPAIPRAKPRLTHSKAAAKELEELPGVDQEYLRSKEWVNPTGKTMRGSDPQGSGSYAASRSDGTYHGGGDWVAEPGQDIVAPTRGKVTKIGVDAKGMNFVQIDIGKGYKVEVFYVVPGVKPGDIVEPSQVIAKAAEMTKKYPSGMTNHSHVQIKNYGINSVVNPTSLIPYSQ